MKKSVFLSFVICLLPLSMMAQDDDLYFTPQPKAKSSSSSSNIKADEEPAYYCGSNRNVDEYNRRGRFRSHYQGIANDSTSDVIAFDKGDGLYPDTVYADSAFAEKYGDLADDNDFRYSRRMSRFDGYYDPWLYDYYGYGPWGYSRLWWHDPWFYGWYDPWYDPWYYGWSGYYGWGWPYYAYGWGWGHPYHYAWGGGWANGQVGRPFGHGSYGGGRSFGNGTAGQGRTFSSASGRGTRSFGSSARAGSRSFGNSSRPFNYNRSFGNNNTRSYSPSRSASPSFGGSRSFGGGSFDGGGRSMGGGSHGGGHSFGGHR